MNSREDATSTQLPSKQAAALAAMDSNPVGARSERRVRRRRRSLRRRLFDSLMPFAVLVGLTLFAAGLVQVVEIGAASQSKTQSSYRVEPLETAPPTTFDFELAQAEYVDMMRRHSEMKGRSSKPQNQVAYQLSLAVEAERDLSGLSKVKAKSNDLEDVMDWSLFEQGDENPRSALQRGVAKSNPAGPNPAN